MASERLHRTLLVPLDGSVLAERALPLACHLSRLSGARLILTRAAWAVPYPGDELRLAQLDAIHQASTYLRGVRARLTEQGVSAELATPFAPPTDGILEEIVIRRADLVVMATHGRSGLGRWVYGSVAEEVLRRSRVPVLLTPAGARVVPFLSDRGPAKVLVPLDGSRLAECVIGPAATLAHTLGGAIVLLRAYSPSAWLMPEDAMLAPIVDEEAIEQDRREAELYLIGIADQLEQSGLRTRVVVAQGPATEVILEEVRSGVGVVAMATHGRTGLRRLLLGSVAAEVLQRSGVPLLLVRSAEAVAAVEPAHAAGLSKVSP